MMLTASRSFLLFDAFRIPYRIEASTESSAGFERIDAISGRSLLWPTSIEGRPGRIGDVPIASPVLPAAHVEALLGRTSTGWRRDGDLWRSEDENVFLPFVPDDAITTLLSEAYLGESGGGRRGAFAVARSAYYRIKPVLPRRLQMAARRRFARVQERAAFPGWPVETALHDLYALLLGLVDEVAGDPAPRLGAWPGGHEWAVVLSHDVEGRAGYEHVESVVEAEMARGCRSAWYFVPERDYHVEDERVAALEADGFEVGVHGVRHDGRDLSPGLFEQRLPAMRAYAERWGASGFRAPATQRNWQLMPQLGFDYDSSFSDVARYEPQPGGCCSWLPFFIEDLVELPITLPMDHTLFELLGHADGAVWLEKADFLRRRGGMALMLTHPDYMLDERSLRAYEAFLDAVAGDPSAWHALPRDVSAWWRRRAASSIEHGAHGWQVVGPAAAEARVETGPLP